MADLHGRVVAFLEARRASELASLIERHQGVPLAAPCLRELHRPEAPELAAAIDLLCDGAVSTVVFLTGVGTATLFEAARYHERGDELIAALATKRVASRGPKPTAVLRQAGVRIDLLAPAPHTTRELLTAMDDWELDGHQVIVQLYGGVPVEFLGGLSARGADVVTVSPYAWDRPVDAAPVVRLIAELVAERVDALLGTSASQVDNLFAIADERGQSSHLRLALTKIIVAAQGPVCAAAFARHGVRVDLTPPTGHMGALVLALAAHWQATPPVESGLAVVGARDGGW